MQRRSARSRSARSKCWSNSLLLARIAISEPMLQGLRDLAAVWNCPMYAAALRLMSEHLLPPGYRWQRGQGLARVLELPPDLICHTSLIAECARLNVRLCDLVRGEIGMGLQSKRRADDTGYSNRWYERPHPTFIRDDRADAEFRDLRRRVKRFL